MTATGRNVELTANATENSFFFSGPLQSQSGFFPVLWTGLLNTTRPDASQASQIHFDNA